MIDYLVVTPTGEIVGKGTCPRTMIKAQATGVNVAVEGTCDLMTDRFDLVNKVVVKQPIAQQEANHLALVRKQRGGLIASAGTILSEYMLPDSFPNLTPAQKQAKIDTLIAYRQALRDITTQPDPANIVWPLAPV